MKVPQNPVFPLNFISYAATRFEDELSPSLSTLVTSSPNSLKQYILSNGISVEIIKKAHHNRKFGVIY
jgi:hypothetical protein